MLRIPSMCGTQICVPKNRLVCFQNQKSYTYQYKVPKCKILMLFVNKNFRPSGNCFPFYFVLLNRYSCSSKFSLHLTRIFGIWN